MHDKKKNIFEALRRIAIAYGQNLNLERLSVYTEVLYAYDEKKVSMALLEALKTIPRFPSIAEIIQILEPRLDTIDRANEMAGEILNAAKTFGQYNWEGAKKYLGPEAWFAVERFGGWFDLCCLPEETNMGTLRAQLRDICKVALKVAKRNVDNPELLSYEKKGMVSINELFKDNLKQIEENH